MKKYILKKKEQKNLDSIKNQVIPLLAEIENELTRLTKLSSERDYLKKDIELKNSEIQKVRIQFTALRDEINKLQEARSLKENAFIHIKENLGPLILDIDDASIKELGQELKALGLVQKSEVEAREAKREKDFLNEQLGTLRKSLDSDGLEQNEVLKNRNILADEIAFELQGEKASELIQKLNLSVKTATDEWSKHQNEQKNLEKNLKELQGRLYPLEELTKDYEVQFSNEMKTIRDLALHDFQKEGPKILAERLRELNLGLTSSQELFSPLKDVITSEKDLARKDANEIRMNFASVSTKLVEWEKVQDKIQLLTLQNKEIKDSLSRKMRLFEVLGKDELRTFVLSLVEESLIEQTNDELQKLCQGRYQIVHQTRSLKMTPEFYILDKYREGGKRKVSTLSGGETFMVSLAMALALAEMTRGQAEIDSLFIDEGFGSLDQESLEDVLDMLQQIQTRGLMVGVISHIKTLTNAIPVNLVLNKKHDGVSNVSLIFN
jgi:exonuclease SbcC